MNNTLKIIDWGLTDYEKSWKLQTQIHNSLISQKRDSNLPKNEIHTLILCEHPHVYTLGKSGVEQNLLLNKAGLENIHAQFHKINRGGDITYHGPGQMVAYPILDLDQIFTDVHKFVRLLEDTIILTLKDFSIDSGKIPGLTGVWIDVNGLKPRKICAIGVHLSRWVSLHGLALNVNTDLRYFNHIIPCGIQQDDKSVTSMELEMGEEVDMNRVKSNFIKHFCKLFELIPATVNIYDKQNS